MCAVWTRRSGVQLAYPMDLKKLLKMPTPWLVQPKLNGERCRLLVRHGLVTMLSSEENEITSLPHIIQSVQALNLPDVELDGEIYLHGMSKQEIGSYLRRKEPKEDYERIQYHVFDLVCNLKQAERQELLFYELWPILMQAKALQRVQTFKVETPAYLFELLTKYVEQRYEGIVVRNPTAVYVRKRTVDMLKWKPKHKDSYYVVDVEEEHDQYNTPKGMLGAIWCLKDGETFKVSAGGFTHDRRRELWQNQALILGKYLLVRYPELTDRGIPNHAVALEITDTEVLDED